MNIICKIIFGLVMIAAGIYHIVIYTAEKQKATIMDLFTGVIVMVLGIFLFFTPQIVIKILPYLLGAFVLVDSIWKIKGSYRLKKAERGRWKVLLIGCLIFIALGVSMLFYSFLPVTKMILFSGIILTANGVVDIVFLIMLRMGIRKAEKIRNTKEDLQPVGTSGKSLTDTKEVPGKEEHIYDKEKTGRKKSIKEKAWMEETEERTTETDLQESGLDNEVQDKNLDTDETDMENDSESQVTESSLEMETEETADAADAGSILNKKEQNTGEEVESPNREIIEMLKKHDEPLEEWKD